MNDDKIRDRHRGCLVGLAVGDALGTTLEFKPPGSFEPINDIGGGGPFGLAPGQWTDDTSMALCLAESLIETGGFDVEDQMRRYVRWWREGHLSSTGRCFDIGNTTCQALSNFERTGEPYAGPADAYSAGNGSLMRLAPVPMAFAHEPENAIHLAGESSRTTHGARECIDACRYFGGLIAGALNGASKDELLSPLYSPVGKPWNSEDLAPKVTEVAAGSFETKAPPEIRGTGYVLECMGAALWAFHKTGDFREGALLAINLGDDADTTGAVYGQIAGACYGYEAIPPEWTARLAMRDTLLEFSDGLVHFTGQG